MAMLLGFVDELITERYNGQINFTTNKVGGYPDWHFAFNAKSKITCKICNSVIPLLLQIYAPIKERPRHHRTLYVFACIQPNCWGNPNSWICLKQQTLIDEKTDTSQPSFDDDWGTDDSNWNLTDEDVIKEPESMMSEVTSLVERVSVFEENANELPQHEATDVRNSMATAVIEPDENEPISLDSPTHANCDLMKMLIQKPTSSKIPNDVHFISAFIYVLDEKFDKDPLSDHVQSLLSDYTRHSADFNDLKLTKNFNVSQNSEESYENSLPAHGDKLFHTFVSRIKKNPDQILRYNRNRCNKGIPLFLYQPSKIPFECHHCHGAMVFEMQILPTIINYLQLYNDNNKNHVDRLEFGTAFVYTCKDSCDKSEEECIILQHEKM